MKNIKFFNNNYFLIAMVGSFFFQIDCFSTCQDSLMSLGPDVSKLYSHVRINIDTNGGLNIPVGSKAFAYWRERTPSWIPNSAFAFHYIDQTDLVRSITRQGRVILNEALESKSAPNDARIIANVETTKYEDIIPSDLRSIDILPLSEFVRQQYDQDRRMDAVKYVILAKGSKTYIIGHPNVWAHEAIAAKLIERDPELKLVTGNYISVIAISKIRDEKPLRLLKLMPGIVSSMSFIDYEFLRGCQVEGDFWVNFDEESAIQDEIKAGLKDYFESDTEFEYKKYF